MKNKEFNVRMSVSLTADPKLVSRTKLNPLKLAKSTEPRGYLLFCRANTYVFTAMQYCIEKATAISFFCLVNQQQQSFSIPACVQLFARMCHSAVDVAVGEVFMFDGGDICYSSTGTALEPDPALATCTRFMT